VVVRNYDPSLRPVLEAMGLQAISSTSWGAQRIEELLSGNAVFTVFSAGNGEVEIYEMTIPEMWNGHRLIEIINRTKQCLPVALTRAGRSSLPTDDDLLQTGDVLDVSATMEGIAALRACLAGKEA